MNIDIFESDDDEEIVMYIARPRRPKVFKTRSDYLNNLDDEQFFYRFRLTKSTVIIILNQIEEVIMSTTNRYLFNNYYYLPIIIILIYYEHTIAIHCIYYLLCNCIFH